MSGTNPRTIALANTSLRQTTTINQRHNPTSHSYVLTSEAAGPLTAVVAMIHVTDVERSAEFYRLLGFEIGNYVPRDGRPKGWAWLYTPSAPDWKRGPNLMLTRTSRPLNPDAQDVLFYLYARDLESLRNSLLANGLKPGEIKYPDYLPKGECCLLDPDGYTLMLAQATEDTP